MNKLLLHYACLAQFKASFYKDLLTHEHLEGGMVQINNLTYADGQRDDKINLWGWEFKKNNDKYFLPAKRKKANGELEEVKLKDLLPIKAEASEKVAYNRVVYHLITKPVSAKFRPYKHMSFKELVDSLASFDHSNPQHFKLLWFLGLTAMMDRINFRVCSPPSFGKNNVINVLNHTVGNATAIVKPTLAKLEYRTSYKWLCINEAVDIPKAEFKPIEQFFLDVGDMQPRIEKHSMPYQGGAHDYDISQLSVSMFYNDITDYPDKTEYFEEITKHAVQDRYPAFRVYGGFLENFNSVRNMDVNSFVQENRSEYIKIIETFQYYKVNHYARRFSDGGAFNNYSERWKINIDKLLRIIDMYCDSQEEFSAWVGIVVNSLEDYKKMLEYPRALERAKKKYTQQEIDSMLSKVRIVPTFADKIDALSNTGSTHAKEVTKW